VKTSSEQKSRRQGAAKTSSERHAENASANGKNRTSSDSPAQYHAHEKPKQQKF